MRTWLIVAAFAVVGVMVAGLALAQSVDVRTEQNTVVTSFGSPDTNYNVSTSGTTAKTAQITGTLYRAVRVFCTTDAYMKMGGSTVTATTSDVPLAAKVPEVWNLHSNQYVAFILASGTGTCSVTTLK